jgi:hypothetical protein
VFKVGAVRQQAARRRDLAPWIDGWHTVSRCYRAGPKPAVPTANQIRTY